jgi:hypothetical protein
LLVELGDLRAAVAAGVTAVGASALAGIAIGVAETVVAAAGTTATTVVSTTG